MNEYVYSVLGKIGEKVKLGTHSHDDMLRTLSIIEKLLAEIEDSTMSLEEKSEMGSKLEHMLKSAYYEENPICYISEGVVKCPDIKDSV